MQRIKPANNEIYHIYNRGVEKRNIFLEDKDSFRFIHDLFEFNDKNPTKNINYYFLQNHTRAEFSNKRKPRELLVEILAFCLMPNHFHLMIKQKTENGITEFMRKVGTGYTNFFNLKHKRVGPLFQGKYRIVIIKNEPQFIHLPFYIHSNPLDLIMPRWREEGIKDHRKAINFLENYRWSSLLDYTGRDNFPSLTNREFILEFFEGSEQYKNDMAKWLRDMDLNEISGLTLE